MDYTIYILAEGKSSRMGTDKGLVKIKGKEMVAHCIDNVKPLHRETILISSNLAYEKFGLPIISDTKKNKGPAQGIITALENSPTEKNVIMSCDMPLINGGVIRKLVEQMKQSEIVCFEQKFLYPFPAYYSKAILLKWKKEVAHGNKKMQQLIKQFDYKTLRIEDLELFLNVNTPADLKLAEEELK